MSLQEIAESQANCAILGQAGCGKTTLLKQLSEHFGGTYVIVSSIALAAYNCNGRTIHSLFKIPPFDENITDLDVFVETNRFLLNVDLTKIKGIIIDEISSVSTKLFCLMDLICKKIRGNDKPFGGLRVLVFGDFYQLPPVINSKNLLFKYNEKDVINGQVFETPLWQQLDFDIKGLFTNHRQAEDEEFFDCLQNCRVGELDVKTVQLFFSRVCAPPFLKAKKIKPTYVFGKNAQVQQVNDMEYGKNKNEERVFIAKNVENNSKIPAEASLQLVVPIVLQLKVGTLVMVRKNLMASLVKTNSQIKLSNGTRGIVVGFDANKVLVELSDEQQVLIAPTVFELFLKEKVWKIEQIPLCHAYAFTIHKLQGTTVDGPLCMDLGRAGIFQPFQAYVAASRVRNRNCMFLLDFDPQSFSIDGRVVNIMPKDEAASKTRDQLFRNWAEFFRMPEKTILLSESCLITADIFFRLDGKSWLVICEHPIDYLSDAQRLSPPRNKDLCLEACLNRSETTTCWLLENVSDNNRLKICSPDRTDIILTFGKSFQIYFVGFIFFMGRTVYFE